MKRAKGLVVIVAIAALVGLLAGNAFAGAVVIVKCVEDNTGAAPGAVGGQPAVFTLQASSPNFVFPASCITSTANPTPNCAACLHDLKCEGNNGFTPVVEQTGAISIDKFVLKCGFGDRD